MKKITLLLVVIVLFIVPSMGQNALNKSDKVINLAIGQGNRLYSGSEYSDVTPTISGSFEVGVKDDLFNALSSLGVGAYVGYTGAKYHYNPSFGHKYKDLIIGVRGTVHYHFIDKLNTYVGLSYRKNFVSSKDFGVNAKPPQPDPYTPGFIRTNESQLKSKTLPVQRAQTAIPEASTSGFDFALHVGGRYYFTDRLAGLLELEYGIAYVNIGVALKL